MMQATMIQSVYRGWRTRQLVSLTKKHFEDQCSQIEKIMQLDCRQYEHRSASFAGGRLGCHSTLQMDLITWLTVHPSRYRIDLIGGLPLFGYFIEKKVIVPFGENHASSAPSLNQRSVDINLSSNAINSVSDQRDTEFAEDKGMDVIIEESYSEKCLMSCHEMHGPSFADLDALQQEAVWLESAIRARINVSSRTIETSPAN